MFVNVVTVNADAWLTQKIATPVAIKCGRYGINPSLIISVKVMAREGIIALLTVQGRYCVVCICSSFLELQRVFKTMCDCISSHGRFCC